MCCAEDNQKLLQSHVEARPDLITCSSKGDTAGPARQVLTHVAPGAELTEGGRGFRSSSFLHDERGQRDPVQRGPARPGEARLRPLVSLTLNNRKHLDSQ